jgi:hypothetical protein
MCDATAFDVSWLGSSTKYDKEENVCDPRNQK